MSLPTRRLVAALDGTGTIKTITQAFPELKNGTVLVKVKASLVSPGTEVKGWHALAAQKTAPVPEKDRPFGYSNAGIVEALGEGVSDFQVGDRVACIGWGYAQHTDYAVLPHNLCVRLPEKVSFEQGSYGMLMATAIQVLRRGEPEFGETCAVVGLGLVGLLTARLYQLAGNYALGWDINPARVAKAKAWGIPAVVADAAGVAATKKFTGEIGLDAAVLANTGPCDATVESLVGCMKLSPDGHNMGRIMVVGWPDFHYGGQQNLIGAMNNLDIRRCARTGAGYHDPRWEYGEDYPNVFMRWTTKTNLSLCLRLLEEGKVDVLSLTSHRIPLAEAQPQIEAALKSPDAMLGVVFQP